MSLLSRRRHMRRLQLEESQKRRQDLAVVIGITPAARVKTPSVAITRSGERSPGRPRLDDQEGFKEGFAAILPRIMAGEISQRQAAAQLGVSVRSLLRYVQPTSSLGT